MLLTLNYYSKNQDIGSIIQYYNQYYKVIPSKNCTDCALYNIDCFSVIEHFGHCEANCRKDNTDVIFKKITNKLKKRLLNFASKPTVNPKYTKSKPKVHQK